MPSAMAYIRISLYRTTSWYSNAASDTERIIVAINAADTPYTACHQDLNGNAKELVAQLEVKLDGQINLPPYSVQYIKFE